jgi:hypothetical protein
MTSQRPAPTADPEGAASVDLELEATDIDAPGAPPSGLERSAQRGLSLRRTGAFPKAPAQPPGSLDSAVVEELTRRLPTSELVKIIKSALEHGRHNLPFTESDLLRAMTFGTSGSPLLPPRGTGTRRG